LVGPRDEDERTERDEARDWLLDHLQSGPAASAWEAQSRAIKKAAHAEGISERTLKRAKAAAGVGHYSTHTTPRTTYWTHPEFKSGQSGPDTETLAQLGEGGPTAETRGPESGQLAQSGQLGHLSVVGLTGASASSCGHPDSAITSDR
jgi:hypothetical protein